MIKRQVKQVISVLLMVIDSFILCLILVDTSNAANLTATLRFTDYKLDMSVDLDRDGIIQHLDKDVKGDDVSVKDTTSESKPFLFWTNTDYDAVVYKNEAPKINLKECGVIKFQSGRQVCEQDDYLVSGSNIQNSNIKTIESVRDLEDFFPISIRVRPWSKNIDTLKIRIRSHGSILNVFEGKWDLGTEYITDNTIAMQQVAAKQLFKLADTTGFTLKSALKAAAKDIPLNIVDDDGVIRLLVEGVASNNICDTNPSECYIEVFIEDDDGEERVVSKVYLQVHDIKKYYDHYTAGTGVGEQPLPASASVHVATKSLLTPYDEINNDYVILVHGWRMQYDERVSFAETAVKRLYWSGYRGRFGFFSWPTDYFDKPAWESDLLQLVKTAANPQNYNRSEAIARRTGPVFAGLAKNLKVSHSLYVFAHSMGNVVVSESLKQSSLSNDTFNAYIASQAAEASHAYNPAVPFSTSSNTSFSYDPNWFAANIGSCDVDYFKYDDLTTKTNLLETYTVTFPPERTLEYSRCEISDKYSYYSSNVHVLDESKLELSNQPPYYYKGIKAKAGRIVNLFSNVDFALDGWEFNALTKPDSAFTGNPEWTYKGLVSFDANTENEFWEVEDVFLFDDGILSSELEININEFITVPGQPEIMAHIIPARSFALGSQSNVSSLGDGGEFNESGVNLASEFGYTSSPYDHSAQFLSSYHARSAYWFRLLEIFELD